VREIRPLRARWRRLETAHGAVSDALNNGKGEKWIGPTYGAPAPVLDPTRRQGRNDPRTPGAKQNPDLAANTLNLLP
jgi:hypothetical protein